MKKITNKKKAAEAASQPPQQPLRDARNGASLARARVQKLRSRVRVYLGGGVAGIEEGLLGIDDAAEGRGEGRARAS